MEKRKLIIASVLKPVNDTRMYEKFGLSLGQTNKYDINIIGFYIKKLPRPQNIHFHPIFSFKRLSPSRFFAPFKILKKYVRIKPDLIIITSHELLFVTMLCKMVYGTRVIYDIQENYYRNILYTNSFSGLFRPMLAVYVRAKEYFSRWFIDHYFLAERNYENEFRFSRGKSTVIENKYKAIRVKAPPPLPPRSGEPIRLVFTGTLAESTGVFEAIEIATKLHEADPSITLDVVGYCARAATYQRLVNTIKSRDFIRLRGGSRLVAHQEILRAIQHADFGIIYYPKNKSTMNTMPTKLFEYIGNQLPILIQNHRPWVAFCNQYKADVIVDIEHFNPKQTLTEMKSKMIHVIRPDDQIFWHTEEKNMLNEIDKLLNIKS